MQEQQMNSQQKPEKESPKGIDSFLDFIFTFIILLSIFWDPAQHHIVVIIMGIFLALVWIIRKPKLNFKFSGLRAKKLSHKFDVWFTIGTLGILVLSIVISILRLLTGQANLWTVLGTLLFWFTMLIMSWTDLDEYRSPEDKEDSSTPEGY